MLQPKPQTLASAPLHRQPPLTAGAGDTTPAFFGALEAVLVDDSAEFAFDGAVTRAEAHTLWTWLKRDIAPDLIEAAAASAEPRRALEGVVPTLLTRARAAMTVATPGSDAERRLRSQLGGVETYERLPALLAAVKGFPMLDKAEAFGRALNGIEDDATLVATLQSIPRHDANMAALLMMASIGQVMQPARLVLAAIHIAGGATEARLAEAGFSPLIDALLAHAQNAIPPMRQVGPFADIDLACRAVERFHRLMRGLNGHVELSRSGRPAIIAGALIRTVSDRLAPRLKALLPDLNQSLRQPREGIDRLDEDRLLGALNGTYLLATVRDCRDSLALNELVDEVWSRSGQALELHLERAMDALRAAPGDRLMTARVEAAIKMAENRFGTEYADILRRARDGIERRLGASG
jgi:hypothetical protein